MAPHKVSLAVLGAALAASALSLPGCSSSPGHASSSSPPPPPVGPTDGLPAGCNPLRANGACLLPFPSSAFLEGDPNTATGLRVHLTSDLMPVNDMGAMYDPSRLN